MINKKAQLGKIITSLPVMLLVIVIMIVFLFFTAAASKLKSPTLPSSYSPIQSSNFFFQPLTISLEDGSKEKNLLINLIVSSSIAESKIESIDKEIFNNPSQKDSLIEKRKKFVNYRLKLKTAIQEMLKQESLLNKDKKLCFILITTGSPTNLEEATGKDMYYAALNGEVSSLSNTNPLKITYYDISLYQKKEFLSSLPQLQTSDPELKSQIILNIQYYYGICKENL